MLTVSILTLLNTMAIFFVVRMLKQFYGSIAAVFFLIMSFQFYARFSGTTMTEQLGFAGGNLAIFFLIIGAKTRSIWKALFGLGLLTFALNARAGAFLVISIFNLWLVIFFSHRMNRLCIAVSAIIVVSIVFLSNIILVRIVAEPHAVPFSNYSYTLYGLASGNKV